MFQIALIHPDIPQNTGNIARLCVGLDVNLHLVKPMGFVLDNAKLKRAGLDYWAHLKLTVHDSPEQFFSEMKPFNLVFLTTKTQRLYTDYPFTDRDVLVFGSESRGLPPDYYDRFQNQLLTIPMPGAVRSLNLSNSVAVVAYEAYRQINYKK